MICSLCRILVSKYSKIYYCLEDVLFSRELSPQLTNHVYQNTTEYLRQIYSTVVGIPMPWCSGNGQTRPSTLASTIQTEVATTSPPCMLHRHCSSMDILRHTLLHVHFVAFMIIVCAHSLLSWYFVWISLYLCLCGREVAGPFAAATLTAAGTALYLNKVVVKVTVAPSCAHSSLCTCGRLLKFTELTW